MTMQAVMSALMFTHSRECVWSCMVLELS